MQQKKLTAAIIIALCGSVTITTAQENTESLETVTVIDNAGDTVTNAVILDQEEINKSLANNPRDLLKDIPGVELKKGPGSTFSSVRMRGMSTTEGDGDRVAINIDGVPMADSFVYGHATSNGQSYFDTADLKAIDVKKGAGIVTGEYNGLAGTVSFVTKDPKDYLQDGSRFGGNVRVGYSGMDNSYNGGFSVAGQFTDEFSGMFSYTYRNFHEIENYDGLDIVGKGRTAINPTDANSNNVLAKLVFAPNNSNQFKLKLENYKLNSDTKILDRVQSAEADRFDRIDTNRKTIALSHDFAVKTAAFDSGHWQVYYQDSQQDRDNEFHGYSSRRGSVTESHTKYSFKELGANARFSKQISNHTLGYGFRLRKTDVTTRLNYQNPGSYRPYQTQPDTVTSTYSVFVNDKISFADDRFNLLPAVELTRYSIKPEATDKFFSKLEDSSQTSVSWSLGSTFDINDNHQLFASYRQGLKVPSLLEQNPGAIFAHGLTYLPNPGLKPEKSKTFELGLRSTGDLGSQTVSLFHDSYQNMIETKRVSKNVNQNYNSPNDITIYGLEYQGVLNLEELGMPEGLKLKGGLTYTKAREETDKGKQPYSNADPLSGRVGLAYDAPDGVWGVEWTTLFTQAKKAKDISNADRNAQYGAKTPVPGYGVSNLTAYYKPMKNLHINAGVYNIFDKKYAIWSESQATDAYYSKINYDNLTEPGRTFGVNFRYDF